MKKLLIFALLLFLLSPNLALSISGAIVDNNGIIQNVYFTGDSTDPKTWYQDAIDGNPDLGLEICGVGPQYVGATYAINVNGQWKYSLITYKSDTEALSYTDVDAGNNCYYTTAGYLTISPSHLTTPDPDVYFAAFPGRVFVAYASNANPGTLSNFVLANGQLLGSYSVSRSYHQNTNSITVETPTINFQTPAGSFSKAADDTTFGVNDERRMVVGICAEGDYGENCYSGVIVPTEANFPLSLASGASPVDDQHVYRRNVVINGLGYPICIGANLKVSITPATPDPVYYSQNISLSYTISNPRDTPDEDQGGNVEVTTDFYLNIKIYNASNPSQVVYNENKLITHNFAPGDSLTQTFTWKANVHSGTYKIEFTVDSTNNIAECVENDNTAIDTFEVKPVVIPEIWINGNKTDVFPYPGRPYNFSLYLKNSDNETLRNAYVKLVEKNGLSLFTPTQIWDKVYDRYGNTTKNATIVTSITEVYTDYYGWINITLIPTGNRLFAPEYSYTNARKILGDYSLYLTGKYYKGNVWEDFKFVINGELSDIYPLHVAKLYTYKSYGKESTFFNQKSYAEVVMDFIYTVFANFWKAITK